MDYYNIPLNVQAYEALKERILSGEITPGELYSETKIAQELGFSRTPIRDALHRLAQERYIDIVPSKGFKIHELNEEDLLHTFQIRCALEGYCVVQLAKDYAKPQTKEIFNKLDYLLNKQREVIEKNGTPKEFRVFDSEFHNTIVKAIENPVIIDTFTTLAHQMSDQSLISLELEGRMEDTVDEHSKILENMKKGHFGRSYKAALAHLENNKGLIAKHYQNQQNGN